MALHVVLGAGPVGSATALLLADRGDSVRVVTRSGAGPEHPRIERIAADATDAAAITRLADQATALYQCAQPAYHRWAVDFMPLAEGVMAAARATGAVLVSVGNLYGYGPVDAPMTEQLPDRPNTVKGRARAQVWAAALSAHQAGRLRTAEVRGSDYLGGGAKSAFTAMVLPAVLAGRKAMAPGDIDASHSWTDVADMARTLVAVADDDRAWGRVWHAPTPGPMSIRALADLAAELSAAPAARVVRMPGAILWIGGLFNSDAREMREMRYQFDRPFIINSSDAQTEFALTPTPTRDALQRTIAALLGQPAG